MEVPLFTLKGKRKGKVQLPKVFLAPIRPDLIHRAFWILFTHRLQPKGVDPEAGKKTSATTYNPPTGRGISRVPRVKGERYPRAGMAANIAGVVKGRQAHPPRAEKRIRKEMNRKERLLALASAIASTAKEEMVRERGHKLGEVAALPLVVEDGLQGIKKAKELLELLKALGLEEELERIRRGIKRRSGTAARRGRVKRTPRGPLLVVAKDEGISRACGALPGIEFCLAKDLSVLELAPGGKAGRLVVWSRSALEELPKGLRLLPSLEVSVPTSAAPSS